MTYRAATGVVGAALRLGTVFGRAPVLRQRLALEGLPPVVPYGIWVHGASMGELASARPIIKALHKDFPLIITANSRTGRDLAAGWGLPSALAPLDVPGAVSRFIAHTRPALAISIEAELWPNRAAQLTKAGVAQALISARLSPASARRWARLPRMIKQMLAQIDAASAQDAQSQAQLLALGLPAQAVLPPVNLKLIGPRQVTPPLPTLQRDMTLLIASSHEDEEDLLLAGVRRLRADFPALRIIWAPRHPERFAPLSRALPDFARRSAGADASAHFLLADTMGEMGLWYDAAGCTLVAGSFGAAGGHSPWEAAGHASAILHGPHTVSAANDYNALQTAGAALRVDATSWAKTLMILISDKDRLRTMGKAARDTLDQRAGDPAALIARLKDLAALASNTDISHQKKGKE